MTSVVTAAMRRVRQGYCCSGDGDGDSEGHNDALTGVGDLPVVGNQVGAAATRGAESEADPVRQARVGSDHWCTCSAAGSAGRWARLCAGQ
jgi:hypothetical protein